MKLRNKKVLVTGGAGFIGSNLIVKLKKLGAKVESFDHSQGKDILDKNALRSTIKKKFDIIYHLAGYSGGPRSNQEIVKTMEINTIATANLLKFVKEYSRHSKIILSNSRLEYGKPSYLPIDEKHPTNPNSVYGISKLASTQIAMLFSKNYGLKITVLRTSNVYGPTKSKKFMGYNIINYFIDIAKRGKTIEIFGTGEQERDYLYITDLIDAFILLTNENASGQIFNLGYGKGIKVKDMAEIIVRCVGDGKIKFRKWPKEYKEVETGSYITDIRKIQRMLGFNPRISFKEGVECSIQS